MPASSIHVVTGAFGYSGSRIAPLLLEAGHTVRTLTNHPRPDHPLAGRVQVHPLNFADPDELTESLQGASVLYNTYWVRFNHKNFTHAAAVANTKTLFAAARAAGVRKIVHVSITNPDEHSPLSYFRGKAELERTLIESGVGYSILRPAVLFGGHDILINNIAWMLRRMPFFGVFGDGQYRLDPIHVEDLAALAVREGESDENRTIDAVGPESFTYRELVSLIGKTIGKSRPIISLPPTLGWLLGRIAGFFLRDVIITRDEVRGLMDNRLHPEPPVLPPSCEIKLSRWVVENADTIGRKYAHELARRTRKPG